MQRLRVALLPLVLIGAFAAAGCGTPTTPATPVVIMTSNNFVQQAITIKAGSQVQFVDPADSGGLHILCFGHNQTCAPNPKGPAELGVANGIQFNAGDSKIYTFANPGTYEITCTIHHNMNVTVTAH